MNPADYRTQGCRIHGSGSTNWISAPRWREPIVETPGTVGQVFVVLNISPTLLKRWLLNAHLKILTREHSAPVFCRLTLGQPARRPLSLCLRNLPIHLPIYHLHSHRSHLSFENGLYKSITREFLLLTNPDSPPIRAPADTLIEPLIYPAVHKQLVCLILSSSGGAACMEHFCFT